MIEKVEMMPVRNAYLFVTFPHRCFRQLLVRRSPREFPTTLSARVSMDLTSCCSGPVKEVNGPKPNFFSVIFFASNIKLDYFSLNYPIHISDTKSMVPQLLEVNYSSDCKRACEYYPEFFNDVLAVMFLDEVEGHNVAILE